MKIVQDLELEIAKNTLPPLKIKIIQDFGFELVKNTSSSPSHLCAGNGCVETNPCIPYGYRLICTLRANSAGMGCIPLITYVGYL